MLTVTTMDDNDATGGEATPMKSVGGRQALNKPSPENKIGGTPPRDPNSISYSSSPIPNRTHIPSSTVPVQKVAVGLLPRAPDSPFAPVPGSPSASPEKSLAPATLIPLLPGSSAHDVGTTYGALSPRSAQQSQTQTHGNGVWSQLQQGRQEPSNDPFTHEPVLGEDNNATRNITSQPPPRPSISEFDPLRQPALPVSLETIDGQGLVGRSLHGAQATVGPQPTAISGQGSSRGTSFFQMNNHAHSLQDLAQTSLSESHHAVGPMLTSQHADSAYQFKATINAPPPQQQLPLPQQQQQTQQHGRAMSWDTPPSWGMTRSGSGTTLHSHSNSHESILAPKMSAQDPRSDPFEKLMSSISPNSGEP